ncbi:dipeptide ABC transporter ATP-binding protein [Amycolatopsis nigrescens]|uniref:dipeptide ABC transporter ATP-binding protein n=1 Tax=Amycolatopsis nigrescens TaxID=381445 RepID=UPI0003A66D9C|nr:ABC transporter ATP-binding protein [Amycolatopsis nigrescens]
MSGRTAVAVEGLAVTTDAGTPILHEVSYRIAPGEVLALVGESGSGKTTAGLAALGHFRTGLRPAGGTVVCPADGEPVDILALGERDRRALRGRTVAYIPQDPALSLNPALRIGTQIAEVLTAHGFGDPARCAERVTEVLDEVGLPSDEQYRRRYPHQLSGGQQQRVGIAMAFACRPAVVVLDEPTTGLDVTTQALILDTVRRLTVEHAVAALYITHDLAVVSVIADRVAVMYRGSVVEQGSAAEVLGRPRHEYTRRLMTAVPDLAGTRSALVTSTPATGAPGPAEVLSASGITVSYGDVHVLRGVGLSIEAGESLMLLGESGSGKTTLSRCVCGLVERYSGSVRLGGTELSSSTKDRTAGQRRDVQYVFQSPFSSLNPRKTIAQSLEVPLAQLTGLSRAQRRERVAEVLEQVRFSPSIAHRLPGRLSGGERQRAAIARALVTTPKVLVCDEVTSALDVSVQKTIIDLLAELRAELGMAILFVTHNIALARHVADRIAVLRDGEIVESGAVHDVLEHPAHEYTRELLANTPRL